MKKEMRKSIPMALSGADSDPVTNTDIPEELISEFRPDNNDSGIQQREKKQQRKGVIPGGVLGAVSPGSPGGSRMSEDMLKL